MQAEFSDYLGSDAQRLLLQRGRMMHELTRNDPRFTFYGRAVGLTTPEEAPLEMLVSLARLQGNANYWCVAPSRFDALRQGAEDAGLKTTRYDCWMGGSEAVGRARSILADTPPPKDLRFLWIDANTPDALVASFGETALGCGVLPPSLAVLTGRLKPGVALAAVDGAGKVISTAAAASFLHADYAAGNDCCWWGMLATRNERRGARLSLILGSKVLLEMYERYGFQRFFTGVEPGNGPSEAVCARTGLVRSGDACLSVADPSLLPGGRMTK